MMRANVSLGDLERLFETSLNEILEAVDGNLDQIATSVKADAIASAEFIDKTGNLRKSIRKRKSKFENGGYIVLARGKSNKNDSEGDKGYHAHLVEFGHVKVLWGKPTGERVPAHPFMRKALEKNIGLAVELFRNKK
jgi:hypothetical protein